MSIATSLIEPLPRFTGIAPPYSGARRIFEFVPSSNVVLSESLRNMSARQRHKLRKKIGVVVFYIEQDDVMYSAESLRIVVRGGSSPDDFVLEVPSL